MEITADVHSVGGSMHGVGRTEESICQNFNPQIVEEGVDDQVAYVTFSYYLQLPEFCDSEDIDLFYTLTREDGSDPPEWMTFNEGLRSISGIPRDEHSEIDIF